MSENIEQSEKPYRYFWLFWYIPVTVGIFLRLYIIQDQIPLDDEWHGIDFAADHSLWYILTHYIRAGATCIPLNLYRRFLLETYGLSEILLVLPSLAGGILSLIVFPFLLRKIFSKRVLFVFNALLAISPFLIFYSRFARPYSIYCFLFFLSFISLYQWGISGEKKYAVIYMFAGAFGIYFHMLAAISSLAPMMGLFFFKILQCCEKNTGQQTVIKPDINHFFKILFGLLFFTALLLFYPLLNTIGPLASGDTEYSLYSFTGLTGIISGTSNPFLTIIFFILFSAGLFHMQRTNPVFSTMILSVFTGYFLFIVILKPYMSSVPVIMARYLIPVFPISYLYVALGFDCLAKKMKILSDSFFPKGRQMFYWLTTVSFLTVIFWTGPIKNIYHAPNNFTNHSAFQENYTPIDWNYARPSESFPPIRLTQNNIPHFYKQLSQIPDGKKIIEYPMPLGNHYNPFYYYQHFHKKEVAAGYVRFNYQHVLPESVRNEKGKIAGNYYIDFVLSKVDDPGRLKFRNIVDISNIENARESHADFLILHKHIIKELMLDMPDNHTDDAEPWQIYPLVKKLEPHYRMAFGEPVFEDKDIVVFKIR